MSVVVAGSLNVDVVQSVEALPRPGETNRKTAPICPTSRANKRPSPPLTEALKDSINTIAADPGGIRSSGKGFSPAVGNELSG